jgi:hypothetical protein
LTLLYLSLLSPLFFPLSSLLSSPPPSIPSQMSLHSESDNVVSCDGMYAGINRPNKRKRKRTLCGARCKDM